MTTQAARLVVEVVVGQEETEGGVEGEMGASKLGEAQAGARWKAAAAVEGRQWGVGRARGTPPVGVRKAVGREEGASSGAEEGATRIDHRAVWGRGSSREKEAEVRGNVYALKRSFRTRIGGNTGHSWLGLPSILRTTFRAVLHGGWKHGLDPKNCSIVFRIQPVCL